MFSPHFCTTAIVTTVFQIVSAYFLALVKVMVGSWAAFVIPEPVRAGFIAAAGLIMLRNRNRLPDRHLALIHVTICCLVASVSEILLLLLVLDVPVLLIVCYPAMVLGPGVAAAYLVKPRGKKERR